MLRLQVRCAFHRSLLVDVRYDFAALLRRISQLHQRLRHGVVHDLDQPAAHQFLVLHQRQVRLDSRGVAIHHEPDRSRRRQHRHLRILVPELFTMLQRGEKFGYKNSQVTVLAPTGTIGFMMDCDTTGIEPDLSCVKYKKLVGGGVIKIVTNTVPQALMKLGYTPEQASEIVSYIDKNGKIDGAPFIKPEHIPVFDCSLTPAGGGRAIHWTGPVKV